MALPWYPGQLYPEEQFSTTTTTSNWGSDFETAKARYCYPDRDITLVKPSSQLVSPKPSAPLDWLRQRVKEICWNPKAEI